MVRGRSARFAGSSNRHSEFPLMTYQANRSRQLAVRCAEATECLAPTYSMRTRQTERLGTLTALASLQPAGQEVDDVGHLGPLPELLRTICDPCGQNLPERGRALAVQGDAGGRSRVCPHPSVGAGRPAGGRGGSTAFGQSHEPLNALFTEVR